MLHSHMILHSANKCPPLPDEELLKLLERKREFHKRDSLFTNPGFLGSLCLVLLLMVYYEAHINSFR